MPVSKLPEKITYWAPTDRNVYGVADFVAPVVLDGRWEDRAELFRTPAGDEVRSVAVVFLSADVAVDGYIVQGDLLSEVDPRAVGGLEIKQVARVRNVRYSDQEIRAYL